MNSTLNRLGYRGYIYWNGSPAFPSAYVCMYVCAVRDCQIKDPKLGYLNSTSP